MTWKVATVDIFRWGADALPDFVYVLLTNGERYECYYALHNALYLPDELEMIYAKVEEVITRMLGGTGRPVRLFRIEAHVAGYNVDPGELRLWEHGEGECKHIPPFLYQWFGKILFEKISQRKLG